jgi:hypothetical protein
MSTKQHMGANSLIERLTAQVGSRETAIGLLRKRGHMEEKSEKLTPAGEARNRMTAEERAKDRASTLSGKPAAKYAYNPNTNRATLKRSKRT